MSEPPVTKTIEISNHRFGWCVTGHDDNCRYRFQWYEKVYICSCDCHTQEKKAKNER